MTQEITETATFAAGCFWGVQARFDKVDGVLQTQVGFMGGTTVDPTYRDVCGKDTGHAEVVQLEFDPNIVSYNELLNVFWDCHNPTLRDRQGPDVGSQYRSAIFYHTDAQRDVALQSKKMVDNSGRYEQPIVTQISEAGPFYRAEEYHQHYLAKQGRV